VNRWLFQSAEFLSTPPGFWWISGAMVVATALVPFGLTGLVTYGLSVLAIIITAIVLIQGFRDTAAIQAKLDELILATRQARNELVGLEKAEPEVIAEELAKIEGEAEK
jgi:low affinity Fe/Cu permease